MNNLHSYLQIVERVVGFCKNPTSNQLSVKVAQQPRCHRKSLVHKRSIISPTTQLTVHFPPNTSVALYYFKRVELGSFCFPMTMPKNTPRSFDIRLAQPQTTYRYLRLIYPKGVAYRKEFYFTTLSCALS